MRHLLRFLLACLIVAGFKLFWVLAFANVDDVESRLAYVTHRLEHEETGKSITSREWYLVSLSMTGLTEANLAFRHPETRGERLAAVERLTELALAPPARVFDTELWHSDALATLDTPEAHVGYLGHLALLLGTECAIGGHRHDPLRRRVSQALERRWDAAGDGLLDTYPRHAWIPDNAAALAGVAMAARCEGRAVPTYEKRWPVDPRTGVFMFTPRVAARASGAGWDSLYLPFVDPAVAADQLEKARRAFGAGALGFAAWREFPLGVEGHGDADSGPLPFGLSPAGTGFAIGGATLAQAPELKGMLRTSEAAGFTVPFPHFHYLVAPLVGEASVLAGRTATPWRWATPAASSPTQ